MLVFLTARRLKPGSFDQFRQAWEPDVWPEKFVRAYHIRNVDDPDEVISFGFYDASAEEFGAEGASAEEATGDAREARMAPFVESESVDGIFEVIDEVHPHGEIPL